MNLLYILERPIQNDLPYQLISNIDTINTRVICFEKHIASLKGNENINQSVFANDALYSFHYEFISQKKVLFNAIKASHTCVIYGHYHHLFRWCIFFAKILGKNLILTSDATSIQGIADSKGIKLKFKPIYFRFLYNIVANALFVPSNASATYFKSIGIVKKKIVLTPYTVNEQFIQHSFEKADVEKLRLFHQLELTDFIFLFCSKLIERKRLDDLIIAFATINNKNSKLIIIGDGPLKNNMIELAKSLNIFDQLIFTGLVDYAELPAYYKLANILVVPSDHEPYGLTINEAMICGLPVIASDAVGASADLIESGKTGWTYPVRNKEALSELLNHALENPSQLKEMSQACIDKMKTWSSATNVAAQVDFFKSQNWI